MTTTERGHPDAELRDCASRYLLSSGKSWLDGPRYAPMTDGLGVVVADRFAAMRHEPRHPLVEASYRQYLREITDQYEFAVGALGMRIELWPHPSEPYRGSGQMIADVRRHRHLYVLATHARWGEAGAEHADHPVLAPTGIVVDGVELLANDLFRVVHDLFGHAVDGHQFGPVGEEKAWLAHYGMFSPLARPALTAETRGQTCWMYFGPHLRTASGALVGKDEPGWVPVPRRPFAEQKAGLLPAEVSGVRLHHDRVTGRVCAQHLADWRPDSCLGLRTSHRPADVAADLAEAYRTTTFRAHTPAGPADALVGRPSPDLDVLLRTEAAHCWAFLTAWNPGGRVLPAEENHRRDRALGDRLRATGVPVLRGVGIGTDPNWPAEDSLLAVGLDRHTAARIGAEFGQDAIVVGDRDAPAELLWCRGT